MKIHSEPNESTHLLDGKLSNIKWFIFPVRYCITVGYYHQLERHKSTINILFIKIIKLSTIFIDKIVKGKLKNHCLY